MSMQSLLDLFTEEYCRTFPFSGAFRVTVKDEIAYERFMGWADDANQIPIQRDSVFNLYSLTKPFCAIALLMQKDRGLVDLDAHPGVYVPEAKEFDSRVTIRHLLHHVSGLPDFLQIPKFEQMRDYMDTREIRRQLKHLCEYPMYFSPGTDTRYCNINFILCGLIIENVTGLPLAEYMKREIFQPLGMKTAVVDAPDISVRNRVKGYDFDGKQRVAVEHAKNWLLGARDMLGTLDDVYALNRIIKHRLLLKPETWDEALTAYPGNTFGMGCYVHEWHGKNAVRHNGSFTGFQTIHMQIPEEDLDVIMLSNCDCNLCDARMAFADAAYRAYQEMKR